MDSLTPEQANELLEQAQEQTETGEFDVDAFEAPNTQEQAQAQEPTQELDYVEKLAQERAEKLLLQQQLAQNQAQDKPQAQDNQSQESTPQEKEVDLAKLFGDFDEEGLQRGIDYLVDKKVQAILEQKLAPIEQKQAQDLHNEHLQAIASVHSDYEQVVNSNEFVEWVKSQPSYVVPNIVAVMEQGSAQKINEVLTNYKTATAPQSTQDSIKAKADTITNSIEPATPNSLTALGAGVSSDPSADISNMSPAQALERMDSWTPEQIQAYLNRL